VLPYDFVRDAMIDARAARKVVILDCCYSARAMTGGMGGIPELADGSEIEGTYLLTASAETQKAIAPPGEKYTAFTGELINIMENGISSKPEFLDMSNIYEKLHSSLAAKSRPLPQQRNRNSASRISFVRNKSYKPSGDDQPAETVTDQDPGSGTLAGLADTLRLKALSTGDLAALDEAIALYREEIDELPPTSIGRGLRLSSLGDALRLRTEMSGDQSFLGEAVTVLRDAVSASPTGHAHRTASLTALGNALRLRAQITGDSGALSEAIQVLRAAVEAAQDARPDRAAALLDLGSTLWGAANTEGADELADALTAWEDASRIDTASVRVRIDAATRLGHAAIERGEIERGSDALSLAVGLLPKLATWNIDLSDRERQLADFLGLASDAAASKLMLDSPPEAVELLEQGRSVLFSKLLELRPDLSLLRASAPAVSASFEDLVQQVSVDWLTLGGDQAPAFGRPLPTIEGPAADARHSAARRLEELIADIRSREGFGEFLRPLSADELIAVSKDSPVIVVNVSRYRSDALIINDSRVRVVNLPDLGPEAIRQRAAVFFNSVGGGGPSGSFESRVQQERTVRAVLEWLWDSLAEPVLTALGYTQPPEDGQPWPRVFWCPTGLLSLLPIHAAGYHSNTDGRTARTVLDLAVSSYTTTVRDLHLQISAATGHSPAGDPRLLIVALPYTPGASPLPGAEKELAFLSRMFPRATVLHNWSATRGAVRRALSSRDWVHFACHAGSDIEHPINSGLLLADGPFSVRDICKIRLDSAELAVLSGCQTTDPGVNLADEAIHVASAFQLAGYRHVIGTLWPIADEIATEFAELFYNSLRSSTPDPAFALHSAARRLRDMHREMPILWAPLIHFGPSYGTPREHPAAQSASTRDTYAAMTIVAADDSHTSR
jgi:hypothetical protein